MGVIGPGWEGGGGSWALGIAGPSWAQLGLSDGVVESKFFHHVASLAVTYHRAPITVILLLLGLGMGSALNVLVSAWGGSGTLFFSVWMFFCALHCILVTRAQTILRLLGGERIPWKHFALHVVLIVLLPATAGLLPFEVVS